MTIWLIEVAVAYARAQPVTSVFGNRSLSVVES
jgi:hypothetical protein